MASGKLLKAPEDKATGSEAATSVAAASRGIPDEMYGGALPIAKSRRSKKREMTEAEYIEDAPEQVAKKAKMSKATASQPNPTASDVLSIQQEAQELDASEVLDKRTRSKKQVDTTHPSKKKKKAVKKLRQASLAAEEEEEEVVATSLVTREILKQKAKEAAVQKALDLASQISVPADVLLKKTLVKMLKLFLHSLKTCNSL